MLTQLPGRGSKLGVCYSTLENQKRTRPSRRATCGIRSSRATPTLNPTRLYMYMCERPKLPYRPSSHRTRFASKGDAPEQHTKPLDSTTPPSKPLGDESRGSPRAASLGSRSFVRIKLESSLKSSPDFKSPSALRHSRDLRWDATADSRPPQMYDGLWADALRR